MKKTSVNLIILLIIIIFSGCKKNQWSYSNQKNWENKYTDCGGKMQSPINITSADTNAALKPLFIDYSTVDSFYIKRIPKKLIKIYTKGTLVVPDTATYWGHEYLLQSLHFHIPSEHTINGKHYTMEIHFVHKDTSGNPATLAVFVEEGSTNPAIDTILNHLPKEKNKAIKILAHLNLNQLIPMSSAYWLYKGSKASPPCTQNMHWYIMQQPIEASKEQIEKLKTLFDNNTRNIQPLNNRKVYEFSISN